MKDVRYKYMDIKKENYISARETNSSVRLATALITKFSCFQQDGQEEEDLEDQLVRLFIKLKLSGGHHCDNDQTVTKQTKPIKARLTEAGSLDCVANLDQEQGTAARLKALRGCGAHLHPLQSSCLTHHHHQKRRRNKELPGPSQDGGASPCC